MANGHELTELPLPEAEHNKDECIESIHCAGDCEKVSQIKRLNSMNQLGNSRSCPQSKSEEKHVYKCDKCDVITQNKVYFNSHMQYHIEKKIASNVSNKRPCSYFRSKNGCRKRTSCDFDHSESAQAISVVKVPKLCKNGEACAWTPHCKYVHPESGEVLLTRRVGNVGQQTMQTQGFGPQGWSQQPPGWTHIPPPAIFPTPPSTPVQATTITVGETERRTKVIQEFLQMIILNLMCLTQFPSLEKSQNKRN